MTDHASPARTIRSVCLFCGSSNRVAPVFHDAARDLGRRIGEAEMELVYGGGKVGLMGIAANAALEAGAAVTGIIPRFLMELEVGHGAITELVVTESMHDRKRLMYERADAFVTLPGGLGTLDETVEVLTWSQLGLSDKPVLLVNVDGYWDRFLGLLDHLIDSGFARPENRALYHVVEGVDAAMEKLAEIGPVTAAAPVQAKWV